MITGYIGQVRQGKTLGAVRELYLLHRRGHIIYSNIHLKFPYKPLTLDMIIDVVEHDKRLEDNAVIFIDEIHIWLDSRVSVSKRNRIVTYFLLQTGKMAKDTDYGMMLIYTTQYLDQIDKRLRHLTDIVIECNKYKYGERRVFVLIYNVFRGSKSFSEKEVFFGEKYYELYDTREIVKSTTPGVIA